MELVTNISDNVSKEEVKEMIISAAKMLNSYGISSCQSDDFETIKCVNYEMFNEVINELIKENKLSVRINEQCQFSTINKLKDFINKGLNKQGNEFFKMGPLKILGDGSLGARTAYMSKPYYDDPTTSGLLCLTEEDLHEMITYASNNDMQLAIHAIGDKCLDIVLDEYEKVIENSNKKDHRHGIVHCQISRDDQLKRMIDLGVHIYAQSIFLDYDISIVHGRVNDLARTSYSWKTLLDGGLVVSNGSDCPVELPNVLGGIKCAVTRCTLKNTYGPYLPYQAFSVKEAIDSYTYAGAIASFEEDYKGLIKENYLADFVVLDKSPFDVDKQDIDSIKVVETYVDGKLVYRNN